MFVFTLCVISPRQVGYHVVLPRGDEAYATSSGLEFMFEQNDLRYYKTPLMRQYDVEIGDIPSRYHDKVKELLMGVEEALLTHELALNTMVAAICEVDAAASLARVARDFDFVKPRVVDSPVVIVKGGRHPLQQLVVDTFIPNDVALGAEGVNGAIITGPNFSGKSVYLKQVGIIVFLAHVGSFVPADDAIVGLVDRIFTRIESLETCTVAQSTFSIDLNQMAAALRRCTRRSLLLIDEFGKGTAPADGMALLVAMVKSLVAHPNPLFVATTHFLEIFETKLLDEATLAKLRTFRMDFISAAPTKALLSTSSSSKSRSKRHKKGKAAAATMTTTKKRGFGGFGDGFDSLFDDNDDDDDDDDDDDFGDDMDDMDIHDTRRKNNSRHSDSSDSENDGNSDGNGNNDDDSDSEDDGEDDLVPLFTLVPGIAKSSDGLACAKLGNLPSRLIRRSREVMNLVNSGRPIRPVVRKKKKEQQRQQQQQMAAARGDIGGGGGGFESSLSSMSSASSSSTRSSESTSEVADQLVRLFLDTDEPFESNVDESSVRNLAKLKELVGML